MKTAIFISCIVIPVVLLIVGIVGKFKPAKTINPTVGYRSKKSRASQEAWDKAQVLMAKYMMLIGGILLVISLIAAIIISGLEGTAMIVGLSVLSIVQVAAAVLVIPLVESKL